MFKDGSKHNSLKIYSRNVHVSVIYLANSLVYCTYTNIAEKNCNQTFFVWKFCLIELLFKLTPSVDLIILSMIASQE